MGRIINWILSQSYRHIDAYVGIIFISVAVIREYEIEIDALQMGGNW